MYFSCSCFLISQRNSPSICYILKHNVVMILQTGARFHFPTFVVAPYNMVWRMTPKPHLNSAWRRMELWQLCCNYSFLDTITYELMEVEKKDWITIVDVWHLQTFFPPSFHCGALSSSHKKLSQCRALFLHPQIYSTCRCKYYFLIHSLNCFIW